ncbi:BCCT family transporter [Salinisphaera aquimarina]|uniref:BCCT family transporter n=1 Tax=Salinisphaera aquimarina TaxID=2094031 RepID=A0ABV7EU44_9GAMM
MSHSPASPAVSDANAGGMRLAGRVFYPVVALILLFVAATIYAPEAMSATFNATMTQIVHYFGWYYIFITAGFIGFSIWVGCSRYGTLRLGPADSIPDFSRFSWYTMLFSAGIGIGVIFYSTAEPIAHFHAAPRGMASDTIAAARYAIHITWMEWGAGAFAIYIVIGLALGFATHRRGRPLTIRWGLEPLLGERIVRGWIGDIVDITAIVGTVFGLATSLGLGVMQINTGLAYLGVADSSLALRLAIIVVISLAAGVSVLTGLTRGIKWLSNLNIALAAVLLIFVFTFGPTVFLLEALVAQTGYYAAHILQSSFETDFARGDVWQSYWTTFFWAWWIAWGPFVGTFLARISRGRTVREFALGVLIIPSIGIFLWFGTMGWAALHREIFGAGGLGDLQTQQVVFAFLSDLPLATVSSVLAMVLITTFFITSADSGAYVVATLSTGGLENPPLSTRAFWVVLQAAVSIALAVAGGLSALQTASLVGGLPFSMVMIVMCFAVVKSLRGEYAAEHQAAMTVTGSPRLS